MIANNLLCKHNLTDWSFKFDNAKKRYGNCNYTRKIISISRNLYELNEFSSSLDTLLHEIAHALAGFSNGHNEVWKQKAIELGCSATRCHNNETVKPSLIGVCPNCKQTIKRHRRKVLACGQCCKRHNNNKYTDKFNFVWIKNND